MTTIQDLPPEIRGHIFSLCASSDSKDDVGFYPDEIYTFFLTCRHFQTIFAASPPLFSLHLNVSPPACVPPSKEHLKSLLRRIGRVDYVTMPQMIPNALSIASQSITDAFLDLYPNDALPQLIYSALGSIKALMNNGFPKRRLYLESPEWLSLPALTRVHEVSLSYQMTINYALLNSLSHACPLLEKLSVPVTHFLPTDPKIHFPHLRRVLLEDVSFLEHAECPSLQTVESSSGLLDFTHLHRLHPQLTRITIHDFVTSSSESIPIDALAPLAQFTQLTSLWLPTFEPLDSFFAVLAHACPHLTRLTLRGGSPPVPSWALLPAAEAPSYTFPCLRKLDINSCYAELAMHAPNLHTLRVFLYHVRSAGIRGQWLTCLAQSAPTLEEFQLLGPMGAVTLDRHMADFAQLTARCALRRVTLPYVRPTCLERCLGALFEHCKGSLETLTFTAHGKLVSTDAHWARIFAKSDPLPRLARLSVNGTTELTGASLSLLTQRAPRLQHLGLNCRATQDDLLRVFGNPECFPCLRELCLKEHQEPLSLHAMLECMAAHHPLLEDLTLETPVDNEITVEQALGALRRMRRLRVGELHVGWNGAQAEEYMVFFR